jgi:hypothetical protein
MYLSLFYSFVSSTQEKYEIDQSEKTEKGKKKLSFFFHRLSLDEKRLLFFSLSHDLSFSRTFDVYTKIEFILRSVISSVAATTVTTYDEKQKKY